MAEGPPEWSLLAAVKESRISGLTGTFVTGREKSGWRSYGRRWNCIPDVEVLVGGGVEIVDLELLLITLAATPNARSEALEELDSAEVAGRRRLQLANRLFRLRHHLLRHLSCEVIQLQRNHLTLSCLKSSRGVRWLHSGERWSLRVARQSHTSEWWPQLRNTKFLLLSESLSLHFGPFSLHEGRTLNNYFRARRGEQRIRGGSKRKQHNPLELMSEQSPRLCLFSSTRKKQFFFG